MSKWLNKMITLFMLVILPVVQAHALETRWYCTTCHAIRETQYCPDCGARNPYDDGGRKGHHLDPYDMGIPNLHGQTIKQDQMNLTVFWVQTQLKATGVRAVSFENGVGKQEQPSFI